MTRAELEMASTTGERASDSAADQFEDVEGAVADVSVWTHL